MIVIDDKLIETPVKQILPFIQQQAIVEGTGRLKQIEYKGINARVCCPIHKGGQENTPSCDILLEDKGEIPAGTVHCFACGYRANLVGFVKDCLQYSYRKAKEWLLGFVDYSFLENVRFVPDLSIEKVQQDVFADIPEVPLEELKQYDYFHPYMKQRKLTDEVIEKYEVGYDPKTDSLTFPVYVDGKCLFVARRKVSYKRFDLPNINPKPIYGLDYVTGNSVIVCESVINALTAVGWGYEAIALFGTGSQWQIETLNKSGIRQFILALDGDEAGRKGTERIIQGMPYKMISVLNIPQGKDINDLTKEEFENLLEVG